MTEELRLSGTWVQSSPTAQVRNFDVMLEAKASDVALLRLRRDLERYMPEVAAWLERAAPCVGDS
jgi:UV DNA damage repair endonuclease